MSTKINVNQLQAQIKEELDIFSSEVVEDLNKITNKVADETVKELTGVSPKLSGGYAKGWRQKVESRQITGAEVRAIHNATDYRLIHLLEYGHIDKSTGRRVGARPHVAEVEEAMINKYVREINEI